MAGKTQENADNLDSDAHESPHIASDVPSPKTLAIYVS